MKRKIAIMAGSIIIMIVSFIGNINTNLYTRVPYGELSADLKQWIDETKAENKYGIYKINDNNYYFFLNPHDKKPVLSIRTIIVQGDRFNIYLHDKEKADLRERELSIIKVTLPKGIREVVVIYNNEVVETSSTTN